MPQNITLTDGECVALRKALENYLPQLRFELARTDDHEAQHALARLETLLTRLYARLSVPDADLVSTR